MRLQDRVAVITGAARGIGAATARLFAAEGAEVVIGDVLETEGAATAAAIREAGGRAHFVRADISEEAGAEHLIGEAAALRGRIDILVNNAGVLLGAGVPLEEYRFSDWRRVLDVNLSGTFLCTRAAAKHLRPGSVVLCMASGAGVRGRSSSLAYGASKGGVQGLAYTLEEQLRPRGVRVHVICPGNLATEMKLGVIRAEAERAGRPVEETVARSLPALGDPEGVARVLLLLASEEGAYMVGTVFTR